MTPVNVLNVTKNDFSLVSTLPLTVETAHSVPGVVGIGEAQLEGSEVTLTATHDRDIFETGRSRPCNAGGQRI
jgi:hypothetical protein